MNRRVFLKTSLTASLLASNAVSDEPAPVSYTCTPNSIDVFDWSKWPKLRRQRVPSPRPLSPQIHPNRRLLYVVNCVDSFENLPTGSVECFAIDSDGLLSSLGRTALSLSSTRPVDCAISPDGKFLVVAAYGGGTYNVFELGSDGQLGPLVHVRKELGRGVHPIRQTSAHPSSVCFHRELNLLLASDSGCDRVSVFRVTRDVFERVSYIAAAPGSGPTRISCYKRSGFIESWHSWESRFTHYRLNASTGTLTEIPYHEYRSLV